MVDNRYMKFFKNKKRINVENELMRAQRERIEMLKAEVARLEKEIEGFKQRENGINEVLSFAKERAESYERETRLRYTLERERLSAYREKWQKRLRELKDADRLGEEILECNEYFEHVGLELKNIIEGEEDASSEPKGSYFSELNRLKEIGMTETDETTLSETDLNKLLLQFRGN